MNMEKMVRVRGEERWAVRNHKGEAVQNPKNGLPFFDKEEDAKAVAQSIPGAIVGMSVAWQTKRDIDRT